ncbi:uncharacterized protein LOC129584627 [Paramacrobiotus metropolitanus]|uniref:uncharacterized protein LOC129584627 n=1 Tax=Paramacrobiotus metropolitanus TaxID=2943436 RepID=UPI002445B8D3|nr:uncharacterized protein LOC129584627 [Paramacrobiotus metropolitanus]XP_055332842.1 uncharacterized protein LOC129584627 [Paramacrobiotus metropolitanus]
MLVRNFLQLRFAVLIVRMLFAHSYWVAACSMQSPDLYPSCENSDQEDDRWNCGIEHEADEIPHEVILEHESITRACKPLETLQDHDNEWPWYVQPVLDSSQRWIYKRARGYYWTKNGRHLRRQCEQTDLCRIEADAVLLIKDAKSGDNGLYACIATEDCRNASEHGSCRIRLGPAFQLDVMPASTATRTAWRLSIDNLILPCLASYVFSPTMD